MSGISLPCRADPGWHRLYAAPKRSQRSFRRKAAFILAGEVSSETCSWSPHVAAYRSSKRTEGTGETLR